MISLLKITKLVCSLIASLFPFDDNTNLLEKKEKNESRIVEGLYFCINDKYSFSSSFSTSGNTNNRFLRGGKF